MGVIIKDGTKLWLAKKIPVECDQDDIWGWIEDFNSAVGIDLFVRRANETDYVHFEAKISQSQSHVGKKGGAQSLSIKEKKKNLLFHELGHSLGLGHENYHSNWPGWSDGTVDRLDMFGQAVLGDEYRSRYKDQGNFDPDSIMLYSIYRNADKKNTDLSNGDKNTITVLYG